MKTPRPTLASRIRRSAFCKRFTGLAAVFLFAGQSVMGATFTWDITPGTVGVGNGTVEGGTGVWNIVNGNWTTDAGVNNVAWGNTNVDEAVFGGTPGTVTINTGTGITANKLTFNVDGYTVNGNVAADVITLAGTTPTIAVTTAGHTATIGAVIAGTAGLTKTGAGTLTLNAANTYTGITTISAGTVKLGNAAALGSSAAATDHTRVDAGATLDLNGFTIAESFGRGGATLPLDGFGGATAILTNSSATAASITGTINFDGGGAFTVNGTGNISLTRVARTNGTSGTVTITKDDAGTLTLAGTADNVSAAVTVNGGTVVLAKAPSTSAIHALGAASTVGAAGTLRLGGSGGDQIVNSAGLTLTGILDMNGLDETIDGLTGTGTVTNTATNDASILTVGGNNTSFTWGGVIQDGAGTSTLSLAKAGTGTMTITGTNTYTGATTMNTAGGGITLDFATAAGTTNLISSSSALTMTNTSAVRTQTLTLTGKASTANSQTFNGTSITGTGTRHRIVVTSGATGTMNLSLGALTLTNSPYVDFVLPTNGSIMTTNADSVLGPRITVNNGGNYAQILGNAIVAYNGSLVYATAINIGSLVGYDAADDLLVDNTSTGNVIQAAGATDLNTIQFTDTADRTLTLGAGNTLRLGATGGILRGSTAGSVVIGEEGNAGTLTTGTLASQDLILTNGNATGTLTVNSVIANNAGGAVDLFINGSGTATTILAGANTTTGTITVQSGTLRATNNAALGTTANGVTVFDGAALELSGGITIGDEALSLSGTGVGSNGALRNLSGTNTYGGLVTATVTPEIQAETGTTLIFDRPGTANAITSANVSMTFDTVGTGVITFNDAIAITSTSNPTVTKAGTGTLNLTVANSWAGSGAFTLNDGVVRISNGSALGGNTGGTNITDNAALELIGGISTNENITITNSTGISAAGAIRNISGDNTISGTVVLNDGNGRINSDSGTLTLSNGTNALRGDPDSTNSTRTATIGGAGNTIISGVVSNGAGTNALLAITKDGTGTLTLGGTNTYTGATTVNNGVLVLNYDIANGGTNTSKLPDTTNTLILGGGTVQIAAGAAGTHGEVVSATVLTAGTASTISKTGAGSAVLHLNTINPGAGSLLNLTANSIATTDNLNTGGILGGWATVTIGGVTEWAVNSTNLADGAITAFSGGYTDISRFLDGTPAGTVPDTALANVRIINGGTTGNITLASTATEINTLKMDASDGPATITMTGSTLMIGGESGGGIIQTVTSGGLTLGTAASEGTLTTGGTANTGNVTLGLINESGTNDLTINSIIANNGTDVVGLSKTGAGQVVLNGANTFSGSVAITAGTLHVGAVTGASTVATLGASTAVTNNGTLVFRRTSTGALDASGAISGTGSVQYIGASPAVSAAGDFTVNNANTYSGGTTITNARANVSNATGLGSGAVVINSGGQAYLSTAATYANNFTVGGIGWLETGTTGLGVFRMANTAIVSGTVTMTADSRFSADNSGTGSINGVISGNFGVEIGGNHNSAGNGSVRFNAANTYTGLTTVSGNTGGTNQTPTLIVGHNNALGTTANGTIVNGSAASSGAGARVQLAAGITVTDETLTLNAGSGQRASLFFNTASTSAAWDGNLILSGAGLNAIFSDGTASLLTVGSSSTDTITSTNVGMTLRGASTAANFINSTISLGSGALSKTDAGTWILAHNANTYTGATNIQTGTLSFGTIADSGANSSIGAGSSITLGQNQAGAGGVGTLLFTGASGGSSNRSLTITNGATGGGGIIENTVAGQTLTLSGDLNTVTPASASTLALQGAGNITFSGNITGAPNLALTKAGAGTLILSGTNTHSGTTTLSAGITQVGAGGTTGTLGSGAVVNNSSLIFNRSNDVTQGTDFGSAGISGTGSITKQGAGVLTFNAANTFSGSLTVSAGTVAFSAGNQLGDNSLTNTLSANGATLSYTGAGATSLGANQVLTVGASGVTLNASVSSGSVTYAGGINSAISANLTKTGLGTVVISGNANLSGGAVTVSDGTLQAGFSPSGVGSINVASGATLNLYNGSSNTAGISSLTLASGSSLGFDLGAPGTNDVLNVSTTLSISSGVLLNFNNLGGLAAGTYDLINTSSGTFTPSNFSLGIAPSGFNYGFSAVNSSQTLRLTTSPLTLVYWRGDVDGSWSTNNAGDTNWASNAAGTTDLGALPVATDTLVFSTTNASGPTITTTLDGNFTADSLQFTANPAGVTAVTVNQGSSGTLTLTPFSANNGIAVAANAGVITLNAPLVTGAVQTWEVNGTGANGSSLTLGGAVTFTSAVTKTGAGALTLSGSNSGAAGLTLAAGILNLNHANALGTGALTISGGTTLDNTSGGAVTLANNAQTWDGSFSFTGSNDLNTGTGAVTMGGNLTVTTTAGTLTVGGVIGDGGNSRALTKEGAGTLVLTGANTYDGATTVNAGALTLSGDNTGATGGVTMNGGVLNLGHASALGTGTLTLVGGSLDNSSGSALTLTTNNAQTWNGGFTFTGTNDLNLGTGAVSLGTAAGTSRTVTTTAGTLTIGGVISNGTTATQLVKAGSGILTLNAANTHTGGVLHNGGTLHLGNAAALGTGTLTFGTAGVVFDNSTLATLTLSTNNAQAWNADFTFAGTNDLNMGTGNVTLGATRVATVSAGVLTIGGIVDDGASTFTLTKAGTGTLYLKGVNTFGNNSAVTISGGGVLRIDAESGLGTATNDVTFGTGGGTLQVTNGFTANAGKVFSVQAGPGTIQVDSGTLVIGSAIVGTGAATANGGGLIKTGTGTLALTVSSSAYDAQGVAAAGSGATGVGFRVDAGTLLLQGTSNSVVGDVTPNSMTIQLNGGNLTIQTDTASIARANLWVSADATLTSDRATAGGNLTQAIGTGTGAQLTIGDTGAGAAVTLNVTGGSNYTSGTASVTFGATTLNRSAIFNITDPSGAITLLTLGAITGGTNSITLQGNGDFAQSGVFAGTGASLVLDSGYAGTATLNQTNTFTGGVTVRSGTVMQSTNAAGLGTGTLTLGHTSGSDNAILTATGTGFTATNAITVAAGSSGTVTVGGNNGSNFVYSGAVTLNRELLINTTSTGNFTLGSVGGITGTGSLVNVSTGTGQVTLSGVIGSGVSGITQNSTTSKLVLSNGQNAFAGGVVVIKAGTLQGSQNTAGQTTSLGLGSVQLGDTGGSANATLELQGTQATFANPVVLGTTSGVLTIQSANGSTAVSLTGGITGSNNVSFNTGTGTAAMNITTTAVNNAGSLTNATATGTGTLNISADIGSFVTNIIQNSATSAMTLGGANIAFTGGITVNAGTLNITGGGTTAPTPNALTIAGGGTLNLVNTVGQHFNLGSGVINLGGGSGTSTLTFELGSTSNYDRFSSSAAAVTANNVVLNLTGISGFSAGSYDLLAASGGLGGAAYSIGTLGGAALGHTFSLNTSATLVQLVAAASSGTFYWDGAVNNSWAGISGLNSNWTSDPTGNTNTNGTPGATSSVIFSSDDVSGATLTTTLDGAFTIKDLTFNNQVGTIPPLLSTINIQPGTGGSLTITPAASTAGIDVETGAPATITLSAPNILGANQTWTVADAATVLSSSGGIGGTANLIKDGSGVVQLSGTNNYNGTTTVNGGVLRAGAANGFNQTSAHIIGAGGTLRLNNFDATIGSLAGAGTVENAGGANNRTLTTGGDNTSTTFSGVLQDGGAFTLGLTKVGTGTFTLSGTNTYTGATNVRAGTLSITGSTVGASMTVGTNNAGSRGTLLVSGSGSLSVTGSVVAGTNATAAGAIYQSGGTITAAAADGNNLGFALGTVAGGYGYYKMSGGTLTVNRFSVGGNSAAGATGVFELTGGTINNNAWGLVVQSGAGNSGLMDISGGTYNAAGSNGFAANHGSSGYAVINVRGTGTFDRSLSSGSISLMQGNTNSVTNTGILNVMTGGTVRTGSGGIVSGAGTGSSGNLILANFNGGTIITNAASANLINILGTGANTATSGAYLYSGGLTVDTNGLNSTINGVLRATGGEGVASIAVATQGSGYIGAPMIKITGGSGVGATAIANMVDDGLGQGTLKIGSITITNPGTGYLNTDVLTLTFGDNTSVYTTQATFGAVAFNGGNTSGGLTKTGAGILTLSAANTYTGGTTVNAGTLALGVANALADTGNVTVTGGTFDAATFNDTVATVSLQGGSITGSTGVLTSTADFDLRSGTVNFTGAGGLAGSVNVNKSTSGTVTLSGNGLNTGFANVVNITGGTLAFSTGTQLGSSAATNTVTLNGAGATLSYTGAGSVDLGVNRVLTVGAGGGTLDASNSTGVLTFSGGVSNTSTGSLTKTGPGTVIISGSTDLNGGTVTVSDGTLRAGFGTDGASAITVGATGNLSLQNGSTEALALTGAINLANGSRLGFELGAPSTGDQLNSSVAALVNGTITLDFINLGGLAAGTYNLISAASGLGGASYVLGTAPGGFNYAINVSSTLVSLDVALYQPLYWTNSQATGSWSTLNPGPLSNFSTDPAGLTNAAALPGAANTVVFSATSVTGPAISTTLDGNVAIDSLQFTSNPSGVTSVTIAQGGSGTLTLAPSSTVGGIEVQDNAGTITISAPLVAGVTGGAPSQTWSVSGIGASLVVSGATTFDDRVNKTGAGSLTLSGNNTGAGGVTLTAGTLNINSATALGTGTFIIGAGTTINNSTAGAITLTENNTQTWNGSFTFTGTQALNLGTGAVTLVNNATVTTNASTLTVGGTIGDGGANKSLTKDGGGTLIVTGGLTLGGNLAVTAGTGTFSGATNTIGGSVTASGTAFTMNGASTIGNGVSVTAGTATMNGNNAITGTVAVTGGTLNLGGANTVSGGTSLSTGTLNLANASALGTSTFTINSGTLNNTSGGALELTTDNAQAWNGSFTFTGAHSLNLGDGAVTLGATPTVTTSANTLTVNGVIDDGVNTFGLIKAGVGTLSLGAANTYEGTTTLNGGTLTFTADQNLSAATNTLIFGNTGGSTTVSSLNLNSASATFEGAMTVQTNSTSDNTISIGAGETLRVNRAVTVGFNSGAVTTTKLAVSGSGTFTIGDATTPTNANVQIGNNGTDTSSNKATLDMSGLATFYANLGTGTFRVGDPTSGNGQAGTGGGGSTVILADTSTIRAATITSDSPVSAVTQAIKLGSVANVLHADTVTIGGAGNRATGTMDFNEATGTVVVRNLAGTGRAAMNVQNGNSGTGVNIAGTVNFNGHSADLLLSTLAVGGRSAGTGAGTGTFSFDTGTLDATTLNIASRTGTSLTSSSVTGTVTLGANSTIGTVTMATNSSSVTTTGDAIATLNITGGTNTITTLTMGVNTSSAATGNGSNTDATINITGGSTTVNTTFTMGAQNSTANAAVNDNSAISSLNISAGSLTLAGSTNLTMGQATLDDNNLATATISITGTGVLTVGGNIQYTNAALGVESNTVTLNGGTLDMTGGNIGGAGGTGAGAGIITFNAQSGTLQNVNQINGGAGLTKTAGAGANTLILEGTNNYTGGTTISSGVLQVGGGLIGTGSATGTLGSGTVTNNATLTVNRSNDYAVSNFITGTGSVIQAGAGTTTLSGNNDYSGKTTINAGALSISAENNLGAVPGAAVADQLTINGGTLKTSGTLSLSATRGIALGVNDATIETASATTLTVAGQISGSGSLTKTGTGTLNLTAGNLYTGGTDITSGVIIAAHQTALGTGDVTVDLGGTLQVGTATGPGLNGQQLDLNGAFINNGTIVMNLYENTHVAGPHTTAGASDVIAFTGADRLITLSGTFNISAPNGAGNWTGGGPPAFTPALGDGFKLFDWTSITAPNRVNNATFNLPTLGSGYTWDLSMILGGSGVNGFDANSGYAMVVPEPSRALLLLAGLLTLGFRRRR